MSQPCPRCNTTVDDLVPVDTGMRVALEATSEAGKVPGLICRNCYTELSSVVSQGMRLRIEKENREKNKLMLWKNRVNLIKQARQQMSSKAYSEAAVTYEKYLRVLEMVFNLKKGTLSPAVFNNSTRSKELTVVASVYWDLVRIYDTSPRYGDRMAQAAAKLALFLPLSAIYPDIVKKAETFARTARNPNVVRAFLKSCRSGRGRCFIATAVFQDPDCEELWLLRRYRDQVLKNSASGRAFVYFYYRYSPPLAKWLSAHPSVSAALRPALRKMALQAKKSLKSPPLLINARGHGEPQVPKK